MMVGPIYDAFNRIRFSTSLKTTRLQQQQRLHAVELDHVGVLQLAQRGVLAEETGRDPIVLTYP